MAMEKDGVRLLDRRASGVPSRRASAIFYTHDYLAHVEREGVAIFNGTAAYRLETSKALQLSLLARLGLPAPRTRVVNEQIADRLEELERIGIDLTLLQFSPQKDQPAE